MLWQSGIKAIWKLNKINGYVKSPLVHNSYTQFCKRLKTKDDSPAWARTTITLSNAESVTCRDLNGLKRRIGPEKPALVHNSYTESRSPVSERSGRQFQSEGQRDRTPEENRPSRQRSGSWPLAMCTKHSCASGLAIGRIATVLCFS